MKTPATTWLSAETTRQRTVYAPRARCWTGTVTIRRSVPGFDFPETMRPFAVKTVMAFGSASTLWSNRSITTLGELARRWVNDGFVCVSVACADASAGNASATPSK